MLSYASIASPTELRLKSPAPEGYLDDRIAGTLGDPAYAHEIGAVLGDPSRNSLDKALRRLVETGRIVSYGRATRRLYATPRIIPDILKSLSAESIRFLQRLPLTGAMLQEHFVQTSIVKTSTPAEMGDLLDREILVRARCGPGYVIALRPDHLAAISSLGSGLREPPGNPYDLLLELDTGRSGVLALLRGRAMRVCDMGRRMGVGSGHVHSILRSMRRQEMVRQDADYSWRQTDQGIREDARCMEVRRIVAASMSRPRVL